ncbi:hypothetical protein LXL04_034806 [Taraxacum kok-saghyz]
MESWVRRRDIKDGAEREEGSPLQKIIPNVELIETKDKWVIISASNERFSTAWLRNKFGNRRFGNSSQVDLWHKWALKKDNILIFRIARNRLSFRDELVKRDIGIHCLLCPLYQKDVETCFICSLSVYGSNDLGLAKVIGGRRLFQASIIFQMA